MSLFSLENRNIVHDEVRLGPGVMEWAFDTVERDEPARLGLQCISYGMNEK